MLAASLRLSSRLYSLTTAIVPFTLAVTAACGSSPDASRIETADPVVEVVEAGTADVTVVFESGLGDDWSPWELVADEVAERAQTFAYSRPGYGQSEPSAEPRDAAHIVEELRVLLTARGRMPPYVLVGHSFGGAYMELFAKAHPDEVEGVVLVDPRHRDFTSACEEADLEGCVPPASIVASLPPVQIDEIEQFARTSEQIRAFDGFGAYPVRVLTATSHGFAPDVEALWESMLGSLAGEAADGEQRTFAGAGHYLQLERAHEVAEVILSIVAAAEQ